MAATASVPDGTDRSPAFGPCVCPRSGCGVRARGLLRGRRLPGLDCDSPLRLVMSCGWVWVKCCGRHSCSPCAARTRRRNARVVDTGMQAQVRDGRLLWLLTVTAPGGRAHGRWTPSPLYVRGARREPCQCHVDADLAEWNPGASGCWNRLRGALVRLVGDVEFYRAAEVQDGSRGGSGRGAIHHHVVLATRSHLDVAAVQLLALAAGYGCVIDLQAVEIGADLSDLAAYVSKRVAGYVSKSSGAHRLEVPWRADVVDQDSGEVLKLHTLPTYRTHSQSGSWGCTVAEIRAINREQARARAAALASSAEGPEPVAPQQDEPATMAGVGPPLA